MINVTEVGLVKVGVTVSGSEVVTVGCILPEVTSVDLDVGVNTIDGVGDIIGEGWEIDDELGVCVDIGAEADGTLIVMQLVISMTATKRHMISGKDQFLRISSPHFSA